MSLASRVLARDARRLAALLLVAVAAGALAGCGDQRPSRSATKDPARAARAAQRAVAYPLLWVGRSLNGLPMTDVSRTPGSTAFLYGTCNATGENGCTPPLEIEVYSICDRNALVLDVRPHARFTARGVEVLDYGDGSFELATGAANVVVWADPGLGRRAIDALRPLGSPRRPSLAKPRYPRYYLAQLRRVYDAYAHTHSLRAVRGQLGISRSAVRFELALARQLGATRLRHGGHNAPPLQDVKRHLLAATLAHERPQTTGPSQTPPPAPRRQAAAGLTSCALEPAH